MLDKIKFKWKEEYLVSLTIILFMLGIVTSIVGSRGLACNEIYIKQSEEYNFFVAILCDALKASLIFSGAALGALLGFTIKSRKKQNNESSTQAKP